MSKKKPATRKKATNKSPKPAKARKAKKPPAPKKASRAGRPRKASGSLASSGRMSCRDAAWRILSDADAPMSAKQIVDAMSSRGLWTSPAGKTPDRTLSTLMLRCPHRFRRADRGLFAAVPAPEPTPSSDDGSAPAPGKTPRKRAKAKASRRKPQDDTPDAADLQTLL